MLTKRQLIHRLNRIRENTHLITAYDYVNELGSNFRCIDAIACYAAGGYKIRMPNSEVLLSYLRKIVPSATLRDCQELIKLSDSRDFEAAWAALIGFIKRQAPAMVRIN